MEERVRRMLREKSFAQKWGEIGDSTDLSGEKMDESVFERYLDSLQPWLIAYNRALFLERAQEPGHTRFAGREPGLLSQFFC